MSAYRINRLEMKRCAEAFLPRARMRSDSASIDKDEFRTTLEAPSSKGYQVHVQVDVHGVTGTVVRRE
jgi:hypothetical protein